jgi:hypothetical protein
MGVGAQNDMVARMAAGYAQGGAVPTHYPLGSMTAENVGGQLHHQQIYIPAAAHGNSAMPFRQPVQHGFMSGGLSNAQALVHSAAVVSPSSSTSSSAAPSPMKMVYGGSKAATVVEDEDESGSSSSSDEASSSSEDDDEEELLPDLTFPEGLPPNALALMQEASKNQPQNPDELAQLVAPLIEQDVATELVTASAVVLITPLLARERAAAAAGEPRSNRGYDSSGKLAVSVSPRILRQQRTSLCFFSFYWLVCKTFGWWWVAAAVADRVG